MLHPAGPEIWYKNHPLKAYGVPLRTRMTIVRLASGQLWLHSPVPLDPSDQDELNKLGEVGFTIAPNKFHHLYANHYNATTYIARGLQKKRPDLQNCAILGDQSSPAWQDEIDQILIKGTPAINEAVFFHRKSRSLVVSDLFFNIRKAPSVFSKIYFVLTGVNNKLAISKLIRAAVSDKAAFKESCNQILSWDFDQLIMCHGEVISKDAKPQLEKLIATI